MNICNSAGSMISSTAETSCCISFTCIIVGCFSVCSRLLLACPMMRWACKVCLGFRAALSQYTGIDVARKETSNTAQHNGGVDEMLPHPHIPYKIIERTHIGYWPVGGKHTCAETCCHTTHN